MVCDDGCPSIFDGIQLEEVCNICGFTGWSPGDGRIYEIPTLENGRIISGSHSDIRFLMHVIHATKLLKDLSLYPSHAWTRLCIRPHSCSGTSRWRWPRRPRRRAAVADEPLRGAVLRAGAPDRRLSRRRHRRRCHCRRRPRPRSRSGTPRRTIVPRTWLTLRVYGRCGTSAICAIM